VVSYRPRLRQLEEEVVGIHFFDESFTAIFGFSRAELEPGNFTLAALCGSSTSKESVERLKQSLVRGTSDSMHVQFYRKSGTAIDVHVSITPLTGGKDAKEKRLKSLQGTLLEARQGSEVRETNVDFFGLLTFRNSNVVQSTVKLGIGILGVERISEDKLKEILDSHDSLEKKQVSPLSAVLQRQQQQQQQQQAHGTQMQNDA